MFNLQVTSHKAKLARGWTYPVLAGDLEAALAPHLRRDAHLYLFFCERQAYWKEDRDRIERELRFRLLTCEYAPDRSHLLPFTTGSWSQEDDPVVVSTSVQAIPREASPPGVSLRPLLRDLLSNAVERSAPNGIPSERWRIDVGFDAGQGEFEVQVRRWVGIRELSPEISRVPLPSSGNAWQAGR